MDLIRHPLSQYVNSLELHYRNEIQLTEEKYAGLDRWYQIIQDGRLDILPFLTKRGVTFRGEGLEIGAGMCWLSAELSKVQAVRRIHALDFSDVLLERIAPGIIARLGGNKDKILMHVGDFHDLCMFSNSSLDFAAVDAALHHTNNLDRVLREVWRVLKPGSMMVAVNEPGIPSLITPLTRNLSPEAFGSHERQFGVVENTYTERAWGEFFEQAGFETQFLPFFHLRNSRKARLLRYSPLVFLNGILFWFKIIIAKKVLLDAQTVGTGP